MDRRGPAVARAQPLQVRWAGRWHDAVPGRPFVIGRAPDVQLQIDDPDVSRHHLAVVPVGAGWELRDSSSNGTFVGGRRIQTLAVTGEVVAALGHGPSAPVVVIRAAGVTAPPAPAPTPPPARPAPPRTTVFEAQGKLTAHYDVVKAPRLRIGRAPDNDVVVDDLLVSWYHAELRRDPDGGWRLVDIGRRNGTFVNGRRITEAPVGPQDVIGIGHALLHLDGDRLVEYADVGDISFRAEGLTVRADNGKVLLNNVGFALAERSLLAVVGPSGAGKSTLLRALTGFRPADEGWVSYADRDLYAEYDELRARIGLVPQDDILHKELTVRRALGYAARLRFPSDARRSDRNRRIDEVIADLGLADQQKQRITSLSGGQRKRTSVALELLTRPSLLFLDEPTSGLDPGLDKSVMQTLRGLADGGRTVVVVTHSVANLDLCDRLLLLAPGGSVAYFGPPSEALAYFGQQDFADLFLLLERDRTTPWADRFRASPQYARYVERAAAPRRAAAPPPPQAARRQQSALSQFGILCRRYAAVIAADRQYLAFMAGLPLVLVLLMHALPGDAGLSLAAQLQGRKGLPSSLLLVLIVGGALMGANASIRELVKEREIYRRERAIGLSRAAYLASKITVLTIITGLQAVVLGLLGNWGRPDPDDPLIFREPMVEIVIAVAAMTIVSMMLGLMVSAAISNEDRGMPLLVLLAMLQFMLSSALIQVQSVVGLAQLSWIVPARWGFAMGMASMAIPSGPGAFSPYGENDPLWDHDRNTWLFDLGALAATGVVFVVITALLLRRLEPRRVRR